MVYKVVKRKTVGNMIVQTNQIRDYMGPKNRELSNTYMLKYGDTYIFFMEVEKWG